MDVRGVEAVELAAEGAGDARSMVEPEEAYAMLDLVQDSRERNERLMMTGVTGGRKDARERLSRGPPSWRLIFVPVERLGSWVAGGG